MDIHKGDRIAWPTNLGWMMGPWLVYASLLNGASIALYNGSPLGSGFAKFVQVMLEPFVHCPYHCSTIICILHKEISQESYPVLFSYVNAMFPVNAMFVSL